MEELFALYYEKIYRFIRRRVSDAFIAEDLTQDVYLKAVLGLPETPPDNFEAWLMTIAKYTVIDHYRKRKLHLVPDDTEGLLKVAAPDFLDTHFELEAALKSLAMLPQVQRDTLIFFARGFSYQEIALIYQVPESKVKSWIHQARTFLRGERS